MYNEFSTFRIVVLILLLIVFSLIVIVAGFSQLEDEIKIQTEYTLQLREKLVNEADFRYEDEYEYIISTYKNDIGMQSDMIRILRNEMENYKYAEQERSKE